MDSLSSEHLSRIFINVLPPNLDDARYQVDDPPQVQATISCVCQRWNKIAESTPGLWTFIRLSKKTRSKNAIKRRLALSKNLPLSVSIQVSGWELGVRDDLRDESFQEMHALLVEQVVRWKTLRVEAQLERPSEVRKWIPSELPNVVGLSLSLSALYTFPNDMESREPFISAPRLTFCSSDSPVAFPLTHCPLLREYHTSGIGFGEIVHPPSSSLWRGVVANLFEKCPRLEVLQVQETSSDVPPSDGDVYLGDWPALPSLTTLRFVDTATSENIRCFLTELKAPQLGRVEFQGWLEAPDLTREIRFPLENNGRILVTRMPLRSVLQLLERLSNASNAADLHVDIDLDSSIDGDSRYRGAEKGGPRRSLLISQLRGMWKAISQTIPNFSWAVPSDEGDGGWKRLGGADLSFDDAIAYLDRGRDVRLKTQEFYKRPWSGCLN